MKHTYLLLVAFFFAGFSFGQVVIHLDSDPQTTQNGQVVNEIVESYGHNVYMHCLNSSGVAANYKFRRLILSQSTSFTDQFCDNNLCFSCTGSDYTTPASVSVAAGDSTIMKPVLNFSDGGTAVIRYYVLDADNGDAIIDSVDVNATSVVGVEDIEISMSAYPNPASDEFFINFTGNEGLTYNLVVYNVLGEEVMKRKVVNGVNTLNVADLKNGVYFYSITNNNDIIETKKLIVRH